MASFTDIQPLKFNPYIQQQPVEAMAQVGMAKQKAHEEGIQKIQTQLDNIAGLEVARDVDKAYLQSKLNELGNKLRTVSAGDFSNFQLVSSASGMTQQLINDRGIQTAVSSAARLKKEREFMEEERKKGELNPANEYVFNEQVASWYADTDVHSGFNGKYDKFFDVDKFMKESFAGLKEEGITFENIWATDAQGNNIVDPKTGQFVLSPTMTRLKKQGMFPEKVQKVVDHVFSDPRVAKQLSINGQYTYRGSNNVDLAKRITSVKDSQMDLYNKNILNMTMKRSMITDDIEKLKLEKQIGEAIKAKDQIGKDYNEMIENLDTQSAQVKGMLYRMEARDKFKGMYTNVVEESTVHENPQWNQNFKMQQEANRMLIHRDEMTMRMLEKEQAAREGELNRQNALKAAAIKAGKGSTVEEILARQRMGDIATPAGIDAKFQEEGEAAAATFSADTALLIGALGVLDKDLQSKADAEIRKGVSQEKAYDNAITEQAKRQGVSPGTYKGQMYNEARREMTRNGNNLNPIFQTLERNAINSRNTYSAWLGKRDKVNAAFPELSGMVTSDLKPIKINVARSYNPFAGTVDVTLTPEDQKNLALVQVDNNSWFNTNEEKALADQARNKLRERGYNDHMIDNMAGKVNFMANISKGEKAAPYKQSQKYMTTVGSAENKGRIVKRAEMIKQMSSYNPSVEMTIGVDKEDSYSRELMADFVGSYQNLGQNASPDFKGNAEAMAKIAKDKTKGTIKLHAEKSELTGEITHTAMFFTDKGEHAGSMTITGEQAAQAGFYPELSYASPVKNMVVQRMNETGNGSTAFGDVTKVGTYTDGDVGMYKQDFNAASGMKNVDLRGNIKAVPVTARDGSRSTLYYNFLYIKSGNNLPFVKPLGSPQPSIGEAITSMQDISPQTVEKFISEHK